jgi:hypothetical protein
MNIETISIRHIETKEEAWIKISKDAEIDFKKAMSTHLIRVYMLGLIMGK